MAHPRRNQAESNGRIDWNAIWRANVRWIRTVVLSRLGSWPDVDDVVQAVGSALSNPATRPANPEVIGPWLYRVAVRQCLLHRRKIGRTRKRGLRSTEDCGEAADEQSVDPLDWLLGEERKASVRAALSQLNELDRQILLLKYTESWTYQQLADQLGVTEKAIEHRLRNARMRLRIELVKRNLTEVSQ